MRKKALEEDASMTRAIEYQENELMKLLAYQKLKDGHHDKGGEGSCDDGSEKVLEDDQRQCKAWCAKDLDSVL